MSSTKVIQWNPWVLINAEGNKSRVKGVVPELYNTMRNFMDFEYDAIVQPDLMFGTRLANGTWNGMIGATISNKTDLSGPYFMNEQRAGVMSFATPLSFSQLALISGMVPSSKSPFMIFEIFPLLAYLLVIICLLGVTCTTSLIYFSQPEVNKRSKSEVFMKYMWLFYGTLLGKDFGGSDRWYLKYTGHMVSFRMMSGMWLILMCVVLMNFYQSTITSTFANEKMHPKIETMEQLMQNKDVRVETFENTYPESCFKNKYNVLYASIWQRMAGNLEPNLNDFRKIPPWMDEVEDGKVVFFSENMFMRALIGERFRQTGKCNIRATPISFCSAYIAIAFNKQFSKVVKEQFEQNLLKFVEAGLLHRSFIASTLYYDICTQAKNPATKALSLKDLFGAFCLLAFGMIISLFAFTIEKVSYRTRMI